MIEIYKPNADLIKFGFTSFDIEILDKVLTNNKLESLVTILDIDGQMFDFGTFVKEMICNKTFKEAVIEVYDECLNDVESILLSQMTFDANSIHFKLNLFILIINSLVKTNKINPLLNQFLELDKKTSKYHITLIDAFFEMIRMNDFSLISCYNLFSNSNTLERSGWTMTNIPTPHKESIAEHMYNMYVMALLYLPESFDIYSKEKILNMIMIHDLAENLTGDIPHPEKTIADELNEDLKAKAIFIKLMFNGLAIGTTIYQLWEEWSANLTLNAKIAHDIDAIQLNYQFFTYAIKYPETFTDQDILNWTKRQPQTEIGKKIYQEVIINNPKFKERIGVIRGRY